LRRLRDTTNGREETNMRRPSVWDVAIALPIIMVGFALAATGIFMFIGVPMAMIGVALLVGGN
jgi:hypothetical protein